MNRINQLHDKLRQYVEWKLSANYTWNSTAPFDFNQGRIFFLDIYDLSNSTSPKFRSHYFNLTDTSNSTANITSSNNSCPSKNAIAIGAGVGGGVGGAILTVFAIFLLPFFKKKGTDSNSSILKCQYRARSTPGTPYQPARSAASNYSETCGAS